MNSTAVIYNHEKEWVHSPYPITTGKEPTNTLRVMRWADLPNANVQQTFKVTSPQGKSHIITVSKHALQVLLGLWAQPVYASSLARIGEYVRVLKAEHGVEIHTERYDSNGYGVYFLVSKIEKIDGGAL